MKLIEFLKPFKNFIPFIFVALLLVGLGSLPYGTTLAQGPALPTPTDIGSDSDDDDDDDDDDGDDDDGGPAIRAESLAGVEGFVYDYSGGVYSEGVTVIFETEGWETETVTDSNGYYRIAGLNTNGGTLNLRLPPGVTSASVDWPVRLTRGEDTQVNLGYYWGDDPPIPVELSATLEDGQLLVEVENNTGETATGGLLKIMSPPGVETSTPRQTGQAEIVDYNPNHFQFELNELAPGETVSFDTTSQMVETGQARQTPAEIRVTFTYDQQITPQAIELEVDSAPGSPPTELSSALQSPQSEAPAGTSSQPAAAAATATAPSMSSASTAAGGETTAQPEPPASTADKEELLPVTGTPTQTFSPVYLAFGTFLILVLCVGGALSLRGK